MRPAVQTGNRHNPLDHPPRLARRFDDDQHRIVAGHRADDLRERQPVERLGHRMGIGGVGVHHNQISRVRDAPHQPRQQKRLV